MYYFTRLLTAAATAALLLSPPAPAQTPTYDRAQDCGGGQGNYGWGPRRMAVDGQGNTYVAGYFTGTAVFGNTLLTVPGIPVPGQFPPNDLFVAKLDAAGNYLWAVQGGGQTRPDVLGLCVDAAGNVYLTGYFNAFSITLGAGGPTLYNSSANSEGFVAKLNGASRQWQWARRFGGTGGDLGLAVAVNAHGAVYVAAAVYSLTADFGPSTLTSPTSAEYLNACWAKLDANGAWRWARRMGTGRVEASALRLDPGGDLYAAGTFGAPAATLGAAMLTTQAVAGAPPYLGYGNGDVFVGRADSAGTWRWAVQGNAVGRQNIVVLGGLAHDGAGGLYVCGSYTNTAARFGATVLPNLSVMQPPPNPPLLTPWTNNYYSDAYVARLDAATGAWQWAVRAGGVNTDDYVRNIVADRQGRVWVGGGDSNGADFASPLPGGGRADLAQLDGATGAWRWALATAPAVVRDLAPDAAGRLHLAGFFSNGAATFGNFLLPGPGPGADAGFVARLGAGPLGARGRATPAGSALAVWPNPAGGGAVWVQGPNPGQAVRVLDALGRRVGSGRMPASGPLRLALPAALPPGLYVVQGAGQAQRLVVE